MGEDDSTVDKNIEKIVAGVVVRRKKPLGKRFSEMFFGGDTQGVVNYILMDILLPAAKDTIADAVSQGIERMLFGDNRSPNRRPGTSRRSRPDSYVSYNKYSSPTSPPWHTPRDERRPLSRRARATHSFDEIILNSRIEAEEVLDKMFELISKYNSASVADLYELVGEESSHTDNQYGWEDMTGARVSRTRGGYLLELPKPEPLE